MINVCVVGYGAVGAVHTSALTHTKNAKLYGVCDIRESRLAEAREKYDGIAEYKDFEEMLQDKNVHSVHICTPHYLHFTMTKAALEAGKKVVCEKPVTMTEEEYNQLISLKDVDKVCVILQNRLNPCVNKIIEMKKDLGKIKAVKGIVTWHRDMDYYNQDSWRGKWVTEGGGALINQAVHTLDLMGYLAGDIKAVKAQMSNILLDEIEVEDTVVAHLEFDDFGGVFFATNAYPADSPVRIEILCENGELQYVDSKLWLNGEVIEEDKRATGPKAYWGLGHRKLFAMFYDEGEFISPLDIKNTMYAMFGIYESARQNSKRVEIGE